LLVAAGYSITGSAVPASASTTSTFYYVPLLASPEVTVPPHNSDDYPVVHHAYLTLQAGETRRVEDRLAVTLSSEEGAEVDNRIVCRDPATATELARTGSGTNHRGSAAGELALYESLLFTAPYAGTFECQIQAQTSDGDRTSYYMTVKSGGQFTTTGTWLHFSSANEVGSHQWSSYFCNSPGDNQYPDCVYLGGPGDPYVFHVFEDRPPHSDPNVPVRETWTAATGTTSVDIVGTFQVTSCPSGGSSCIPAQRGDGGINRPRYAEIISFLEFNQLYPDGSVCRIHQSYDPDTGGWYYIDNDVHHLPIRYHVSATVSPNCGGSRQFAPVLWVQWVGGNPVKLDAGSFNVVSNVRDAPTTTVPNVVGYTEEQAGSAIRAVGLTADTIGRVMNPAPAGTVFEQNSPRDTVEPTGSSVQITVSLGQATVPNVRYMDEASAENAIVNAGLTVSASNQNDCVSPGDVVMQNPSGGTAVLPGTTVSIIVSRCDGGGGGGGGGDDGGGDPLPK
jgi:hypothetical protein